MSRLINFSIIQLTYSVINDVLYLHCTLLYAVFCVLGCQPLESSDVSTAQTDDFLACAQTTSDLNVEPQLVVKQQHTSMDIMNSSQGPADPESGTSLFALRMQQIFAEH